MPIRIKWEVGARGAKGPPRKSETATATVGESSPITMPLQAGPVGRRWGYDAKASLASPETSP